MDKKWVSISSVTEIKCDYKWIIKKLKYYRSFIDYSNLQKNLYIESSTFFIYYRNKKLHWSLRLYPNLITAPNHLSIELVYHESFCIPGSNIEIKMSILDKNKIIYTRVEHGIGPISCLNQNFFLQNYISRESLFNTTNNYLIDDELHLFCELKITTDRKNTDNIEILEFEIPESQLVNDFGKLIGEQKYGDFDIIVGDREFKVYGSVLAVRSPRLWEILKSMESKDSKVGMKGISPEVFEYLLHFIYTDEIMNTSDCNVVKELIIVADKYALERLKIICESILISEVDLDNAEDYLSFAELHGAERLKTRSSDFINLHNYEIIYSEKFESDCKSDLLRHPVFMIVSALIIGTITYKIFGRWSTTQPIISSNRIPDISIPKSSKFIEALFKYQ